MEMITEDKLRYIAGKKGLNLIYVEKDYILTELLYLLKDVKGVYFKGGTALNKIALGHCRLSEDLDYSADRPISDIKKKVEALVKRSGLFTRIETGSDVENFIRYRIYYKSYFRRGSFIVMDINRNASILLEPESGTVKNFYGKRFSVKTLNMREIIAEKVRALITRNQPRDYFDVYFISKKYDIDMDLVRKKTLEAGEKFDTERVFRNAKKIYTRWKSDIGPLTNRKLDFRDCMNRLSEVFERK